MSNGPGLALRRETQDRGICNVKLIIGNLGLTNPIRQPLASSRKEAIDHGLERVPPR
jgi:hypothetical protein